MKITVRQLTLIGLMALTCVGSALWFFVHVLSSLLGYHPAMLYLGLVMAGIGLTGLSLLNFDLEKKKQYLAIILLGTAWVIVSGYLFLRSTGFVR